MSNQEQLLILKQGVEVWNRWRALNTGVYVDLSFAILNRANLREADLTEANLRKADLREADLREAKCWRANLNGTDLSGAVLYRALLREANLKGANLQKANLRETKLTGANLSDANLIGADLGRADLQEVNLRTAKLSGTTILSALAGDTIFRDLDLSEAVGLDRVIHRSPSSISTDTFVLSKGKIPEAFLRGCGLSDWEIEEVKLYMPDLSNDKVNKVLYRLYDLRATQALQISPLFISYSHDDTPFVDKVEHHLNKRGIRFWRDIHEMKAGRLEKQIDRAISQNPTVLLVLSKHSLNSDWVEHEVRTARGVEKEKGRDVLCPIALDDSWKDSKWPKRVIEQIMEYNILDFSAWENDVKFEGMFRKLIDGLELFYKDK